MRHANKYLWFDLIRGLSAVAVCAGHLRLAMFLNFSEGEGGGVARQGFYFATGLGHEAVVVFFVLSGFFVGGTILKKGAGFDWKDYAWARLSRLWVVLLPVLLLTVAVDAVTAALSPEVLAGADRYVIWSGPDHTYSLSFGTLVGNLVFLQSVYVPSFGSNDPLWSLTYEFWYYVFFPACALVVLSVKGLRSVREGSVALAIAVTVAVAFGRPLAEGFFVWGAGACLWALQHRISKAGLAVRLGSGALFVSALVLTKTSVRVPGVSTDIVVGLAFVLFAATLLNDPGAAARRPRLDAAAAWLAKISYSLYVVHFPFVILLYAAVYRGNQREWGLLPAVEFGAALLALIGGGWLFWWMFEKRTQAVRVWGWSALTSGGTTGRHRADALKAEAA